jgi:triacylglycerol esterase/lipase EstA (alpha/beta hydrolase family)
VGVVLMHGKGGSPDKHVAGLANALRQQGVLVANLDMPWSGRREYDADVASAVTSGEGGAGNTAQQGARKLVVAGHSQGGLFALYLAGRLPWMA